MQDHVTMRLASLVCIALALVACVWFAIGIRQAHDTARAAAIVSERRTATAGEEREVASLVGGARLLNPDKEIDVLLGAIEVEHHDFIRARQVLEAVTRSEPRNIQAWLWLAHSAAHDPALLYVALLHVRELEPEIRGG
jgi:Tfp pilus assembly protein PilF